MPRLTSKSPWYHWFSGQNGSFLDCIPKKDQDDYKKIPYLTGPTQESCFSGASVMSADVLESHFIKTAVPNWYATRLGVDFCEDPTTIPKTQKQNPSNIRRWMSHYLLTTTINIVTAQTTDGKTFNAPEDHFFNSELLTNSPSFSLLVGLWNTIRLKQY